MPQSHFLFQNSAALCEKENMTNAKQNKLFSRWVIKKNITEDLGDQSGGIYSDGWGGFKQHVTAFINKNLSQTGQYSSTLDWRW